MEVRATISLLRVWRVYLCNGYVQVKKDRKSVNHNQINGVLLADVQVDDI